MKRDYFYTSPIGRRLFQLDLGSVTLALIGTADHGLLDKLAARYEPGSALCDNILTSKGVNVDRLLDAEAPLDPEPQLRQSPAPVISVSVEPQVETTETSTITEAEPHVISDLIEAVASLPEGKSKNGSGRAAAALSRRFAVSQAVIYQIRKVLKNGSPELVNALRQGEISPKTACKRLSAEVELEIEQAR